MTVLMIKKIICFNILSLPKQACKIKASNLNPRNELFQENRDSEVETEGTAHFLEIKL